MKWPIRSGRLNRAIKFVFVGGSVTLLGIIGLYFLVDLLSIQKNLAYLCLTIVSLQLNFILNVKITWAGRRIQGNIWTQWLKFHMSRGAVAVLNQLLFALLTLTGTHYMLANLICIMLATGLNFLTGELQFL